MVLIKETGKEAGNTGFWQWQQLGWNFYEKAIPLDKGPGLGKEVLPTHISRESLSLDNYLAQLMERRKNTRTSHQRPDLNLASVVNWIPPQTKSLISPVLSFRILKGLYWVGWSLRILWVPASTTVRNYLISHAPSSITQEFSALFGRFFPSSQNRALPEQHSMLQASCIQILAVQMSA